jgi:rRNA-processing protein FCF1
MADHIQHLLEKNRNTGVLVDTNILLLYLVGTFIRPEEVPKFKRTCQFVPEDFHTLRRLLRYFQKVITTPNVLTEISNLSGQLPDRLKRDYFPRLGIEIASFEEHYLPSADIAEAQEFAAFGLTDAGIVSLASRKFLVLTDDWRLAQYLEKKGIDVLNFNHIRTYYWE